MSADLGFVSFIDRAAHAQGRGGDDDGRDEVGRFCVCARSDVVV